MRSHPESATPATPRSRATAAAFGALLIAVALAHPAQATFNVTDERSGETFPGLTYLETPYSCASPCLLTFSAVASCSGSSSSFLWGILDANGTQLLSRSGGAPWRHGFVDLGTSMVWESESTSNCMTGGSFRVLVIDKTAPETTITTDPKGISGDRAATFTFSASEPGSTFECRFDDHAYQRCDSPVAAPPLPDGAHSFVVRATDKAGNTDATPATVAYEVRRPAPIAAVVRARWTHERRSTGVARLELRRVPAGGKVSARCRGTGCSFKTRRFPIRDAVATLTGALREARLRAHTRLELTVAAPGALTTVFRLIVRPFPWDPRLEVLCQAAGSTKPTTCVTS
jgi:hypothetical protein